MRQLRQWQSLKLRQWNKLKLRRWQRLVRRQRQRLKRRLQLLLPSLLHVQRRESKRRWQQRVLKPPNCEL